MQARLKAGLRVEALLRQGAVECRHGVVARRGDPDAGDVIAILRGRDGLLARRHDTAGRWIAIGPEIPVDDREMDRFVARQADIDPDLWVLEFETPDYRPPGSSSTD